MVKLLDTLFVLAFLTILTYSNFKHSREYDMDWIRQIDSSLAKGQFVYSKLPDMSYKASSLPKVSNCAEWVCNSSIFYSSELTLRPNGTFKFHDKGCTLQTFTEGKWVENDKGVFLTSFDAYKPIEKAITFDTAQGISFDDLMKDSNNFHHLIFVGFTDTGRLVIPGPNDTTKIYFKNVRLQRMVDTLFCFDGSSPLGGYKFTRPNIETLIEHRPLNDMIMDTTLEIDY